MQYQAQIETISSTPVTPDHSIAGVFVGSGFSLFGFLILIALLA